MIKRKFVTKELVTMGLIILFFRTRGYFERQLIALFYFISVNTWFSLKR